MAHHFIDGQWFTGSGPERVSINPASGEVGDRFHDATASEAADAVETARRAQPAWANTPIADRIAIIERFAQQLEQHQQPMAALISRETGKPRWEATAEVGAMIKKVPITLDAMRERRPLEASPVPSQANEATRYKPIGTLVVLAPFNLPGHLPNGHIVPALLAGNTVICKPSEHTPATGGYVASLWQQAGLPDGALNLVQGAGDVGATLVQQPGHDGVLLTGSLKAGLKLREALVDQPRKILALEMGGNNPLVVHEVADARAAAVLTVQSAFLTAGQRCTCARRLIVPRDSNGDRFIEMLIEVMKSIRIGPSDLSPEPFMGPMIDARAAESILKQAKALQTTGSETLVTPAPHPQGDAFVTPGLIDATNVADREDIERFGPLLQLVRTDDFDGAINEANNTAFGLVAGLLSDRREHYARFYHGVRAGLINWNKPTTGASSRLPFGGVGLSGNFRPGGSFAIDYCTYPVASLEYQHLQMPEAPPEGLDL